MTAPLNPELFTRELVDTRRPGGDGSGCILELTRSGELRVIVIVNWPSSGLLAQYETLTPEQTRELQQKLAQLTIGGAPLVLDQVTPAPVEMHAKGDRAMHAPGGAWENPFAAEGET